MIDAVSFRRANANDLPAMLALIADDMLGKNRDADANDPAYAQAFAAIDADANQYLMVAERGAVLIGMLQLTFIPGLSRKGAWRANIEAVRVRSDLRRFGIGAAMMAEAESIARERGCALAQLTSDSRRTAAHVFYERLGYLGSHVGFKKEL